ncbi:MAG TPA: family 16 glycoside hydrolase [Candidatus Dormibacteraeota bacterium]|nr:family 16 glycoside hydrolase [Candidatus Dormibacteraeota bacterium]
MLKRLKRYLLSNPSGTGRRAKSGRGRPQSRTLRECKRTPLLRQVLDCGVPLWFLCLALASTGFAAEHSFNFSAFRENEQPPGFRSAITGLGKPGNWKIVLDEAPSAFPSLTTNALAAPSPAVIKRAVLAQMAEERIDEHFPLLIYENEVFDDFSFTTKFKTVAGHDERMAGLAFRIQNETNYYVVRASSLGNTFKFYKIVNGQRGLPVGPDIQIPSGVWHELTLECKGDQIRCLLNGTELISVRDKVNAFTSGKIAFWTKSDSVSYFADSKIVYKPHIAPAQALVSDSLRKYPRLLDLRIYAAPGTNNPVPQLVASRDQKEIGQLGTTSERNVIDKCSTYYGKDRDSVSVTMPLRDRNGDGIAAARVVMKTFPGQTEKNAVERAAPIVKDLQTRIQSIQDLVE